MSVLSCLKLRPIIENMSNMTVQQLCPIPPNMLLSSPFTLAKPDWCIEPKHRVIFHELCRDVTHEIGKNPYYLVGRNEKSNIVIEDLFVSRCHAALLHSNDGNIYLIDLASAHGTYIGQYRLVPYTPTLVDRHSIIKCVMYCNFF